MILISRLAPCSAWCAWWCWLAWAGARTSTSPSTWAPSPGPRTACPGTSSSWTRRLSTSRTSHTTARPPMSTSGRMAWSFHTSQGEQLEECSSELLGKPYKKSWNFPSKIHPPSLVLDPPSQERGKTKKTKNAPNEPEIILAIFFVWLTKTLCQTFFFL